MASQGSELMTDSQADRLLGIDNGDSQADGVMPPPISKEPTPDWLDKKNHPALANPLAGSAEGVTGSKPLMPTLQPSVGTAMAQKMSNVSVAAPAAAPAPSAGSASSGPVQKPAASSAHAPELSGSETDEEDAELTPEEKANADHIAHVNSVIAAAEAAGFTFGPATKFAAAQMYVNNKQLFDDAGVDITACRTDSRKCISTTRVKEKLAELRAAAEEADSEAAAEAQGGDMSQALYVLSEGEQAESDGEQSDDELEGMSKAQLEARNAKLTNEIAFSKAKLQKQPRTLAYQELKAAMLAAEPEYGEKYEEHQKEFDEMKKYWFANWMNNQWKSFTVYQMKFFKNMLDAEIETRELPVLIANAEEEQAKIEREIEQLNFELFQTSSACLFAALYASES